MIYYQSDKYLIQYNPERKVARIRNNIGLDNSILSEEEFNSLDKTKIRKTDFIGLLNYYFRHTKHEWVYESVPYKKLDNFELDGDGKLLNYNWDELPKHRIEQVNWWKGDLLHVYHQGKLYYFTWFFGGQDKGKLISPVTFEDLKWTRPKNCAPIFNKLTKQII